MYGGHAPPNDTEKTRWREAVDGDTPPVRLIANSPLWFWGTIGILFAFSTRNPLANTAIVLAVVVGIIVLLNAAFRDRTLLTERGAVPVASPLWMLLSPVAYLIARKRALKSIPGNRYGFLGWYLVGLGAAIGCVMFFVAVRGLIAAAGDVIPAS
ncbi:NAD synthetase [marine actinobacterium PHSC20C1]|nr:NAD synthetase [marine actinobacterium PHSC20C1]